MKKLILILPLALLILTGCVINIKTSHGVDGGVYLSEDNTDTWEQIAKVYRVGELEKTFSTVDLSAMIMDPSDNKAIYIGTEQNGMYYTYDGGIGWQQVLTNLGRINDIAISPNEKCIIYVAIANRIYKSTDCNRHWDYKLIETRDDPNNQITTMAIDTYNTDIIYLGTSGKGVFRSTDGGYSWQALKFFDKRIVKILINEIDSRILYVATDGKGIYKTSDAGETWKQLITEEMIKEMDNILVYRDIILDPTVDDGILYASQFGLLRSDNGGENFAEIKLLTPPSTTAIYSLAINPNNGKEIYYGIATAIYRSVDGGENWITRDLPSSRAAKYLIIDPEENNKLYLGVKKIEEK